jgi:hypothetical protein
MGLERIKLPEESWKALDSTCIECFKRLPNSNPTRPDCSDRDCPSDLLEKKIEEKEEEEMSLVNLHTCDNCGKEGRSSERYEGPKDWYTGSLRKETGQNDSDTGFEACSKTCLRAFLDRRLTDPEF